MHSIVLYSIVLSRSQSYLLLIYAMYIVHTMLCINLSEYWTTLRGPDNTPRCRKWLGTENTSLFWGGVGQGHASQHVRTSQAHTHTQTPQGQNGQGQPSDGPRVLATQPKKISFFLFQNKDKQTRVTHTHTPRLT